MIRRTLLLVAMATLACVSTGFAQGGKKAYAPLEPGGGIQGYYSARLKGYFVVRNFQLPAYGWFRAARISSLDPDSPLRDIGLVAGDVITRLDGTPVHSNAELDRHAYDTGVRFIKSGSGFAVTREVYIPDVYSTGYPPAGETP